MQEYIKKYFWLSGVIVVLICAALSAKTVNHLIAGKYFRASDEPAKVEPPKSAATTATQTRSKSGQPLADRNMFCSDCEPEEPEAPAPVDPADTSGAVPLTSLPLSLVATNLSTNPKYSFATIMNTSSQSQGAYWIADTIPGAGEVVTIGGKYVDFRTQAGRLERVSLLNAAPPPRVASTTSEPIRRSAVKDDADELTALIDDGVKKTGENSYEIDRGLVDKVLANPMSVARGARIVPSVKNGKANGFKLYAIRPNSVYAKIGLRNGDTLHSINGFELSSPDKALEVYTKVKEASNLSVSVTRRGKPLNLDYSIR